jgi:hypothetical protein
LLLRFGIFYEPVGRIGDDGVNGAHGLLFQPNETIVVQECRVTVLEALLG